MRALTLLLLALPAAAGGFDVEAFRRVAVLEDGRKKPIDTFAREQIEYVTGKGAWKGEDPVVTLVSWLFEPQKWDTVELFKVSHPELVALLDKKKDGRVSNVFSYTELIHHAAFRKEIEKRFAADMKGGTSRDKAVDELVGKLDRFKTIAPRLAIVPPPPGFPKDDWYAFGEWKTGADDLKLAKAPRDLYPAGWADDAEREWAALAAAVRAGDAAAAGAAMNAVARRMAAVNPERYPAPAHLGVEVAFSRWQPFRIAWIVYFVACVAFAFKFALSSKKAYVAGFTLLCVAFAAHLAGVSMRAYVAQRAPWADLYEAMVVVCLMCAVFAIVFEAIMKSAYVGLGASFMAAVGLIGASMLPFDFRTIDPLVPVLRSWWLKYHVLSMITSYGAFTLAFAISALHLFMHFAKKDAAASKKLEDLTYRVIQCGFFFITVGIILGAVWADSAWGRYWGWDPKEIWALVSWFIYGAYIHGRMIGWCRGIRAAFASILGYAAILFTFFGVNFVLTGLHSYANAS